VEEETMQRKDGQGKGETGLAFTRLGDLLAEAEEEKPYLVTGLLPAAGISLLAGKPKSPFKKFLNKEKEL
jgi:hypothetical protein